MLSVELMLHTLASEHLIAAGIIPSQDLTPAPQFPTDNPTRKRLSPPVANAEAGPSKRAKTQVVSTFYRLMQVLALTPRHCQSVTPAILSLPTLTCIRV